MDRHTEGNCNLCSSFKKLIERDGKSYRGKARALENRGAVQTGKYLRTNYIMPGRLHGRQNSVARHFTAISPGHHALMLAGLRSTSPGPPWNLRSQSKRKTPAGALPGIQGGGHMNAPFAINPALTEKNGERFAGYGAKVRPAYAWTQAMGAVTETIAGSGL